MTKKQRQTPKGQLERMHRLMPSGVPRYVRVYDNGGTTADRYTIVFSGRYRKSRDERWQGIGMSATPFHPQSICQHFESHDLCDVNKSGYPPAFGRKNHLGKRITFRELPEDCRDVVIGDYLDIWTLPKTEAIDLYERENKKWTENKIRQQLRELR